MRRRPSERNGNVLAEIPDIVVAGHQSRLNVRRKIAVGIEANRQAVLHPIRIAVYRLAGKIRGKVELGGRVPGVYTGVSRRALGEGNRGAKRSVSIFIIEGDDAVRRMMRSTNRESAHRARANRVAIEVEGVISATPCSKGCATLIRAPAREDLYDASHRVGTVQHAGG